MTFSFWAANSSFLLITVVKFTISSLTQQKQEPDWTRRKVRKDQLFVCFQADSHYVRISPVFHLSSHSSRSYSSVKAKWRVSWSVEATGRRSAARQCWSMRVKNGELFWFSTEKGLCILHCAGANTSVQLSTVHLSLCSSFMDFFSCAHIFLF